MKKLGFTLAEVLITLGIIGVVAAMTLPTVIHKIQMAVLHSQFKTTLSAMSNAIEKTRLASEYSLRCYDDDNWRDCSQFNDLFESQFKIIKVCPNNAYANGCIGDIKGVNKVTPDKNSSKNYGATNMYFNDEIKNNRYVFVTSGGFSVGYYMKPYRPTYFIDVNGPKGPNKWGYDVFSLALNSENTKLMCSISLENFFEEGGRSCIDMITNKK